MPPYGFAERHTSNSVAKQFRVQGGRYQGTFQDTNFRVLGFKGIRISGF